MRSVRNLAVPTFKNRTYEPRVEVLLADTLIKTLQEDGTYTIVSEDNAEAIMYCTLTKVERVRSARFKTTCSPPPNLDFGWTLPIRSRIA